MIDWDKFHKDMIKKNPVKKPMKLKIREQDICAGINKYLKLMGICYRRIHNLGFATMKGTPDYWIVIRGTSVAMEVKKPDAHLTPEQRDFLMNHKNNGMGISAVVRSVDEAISVIKDIINGYLIKGDLFSSQKERDFPNVSKATSY